ncbi:carbohydrate ABC transporter permease [Streptomyces diacarni]|uniref:carbohydrate ABC transporter permease n=1 Tax=Streptomyces diacarni TaxID=2800381 RepID=UPI001FECCBAD|nr:carbohydrate ABC transporter permease [Streptomyces diacarni]
MRRGGAGVNQAAGAYRTERWSGYVLLTAGAVAVVVPFLSVFLASMQPSGEPVVGMEWPQHWSLDNYRQAWTVAGFSSLMRSSALIAVGVVPASLVLAGLAGYALGTMRLPGGDGVAALFVAGLTIPVELIVVPLYFDLRSIGLTDSYLGVILVEIALFLPFSVFWMRTHFRTTPPELVEAARIDGASSWTVLFRVLLPLARPALTTLGVLVFMWSWNQFLLVLVLIQDATKRTAPAGLGFFVGQNNTDVPMLAAGTILVMLPITIVYVLFQRSFVAGLLQGAFKG